MFLLILLEGDTQFVRKKIPAQKIKKGLIFCQIIKKQHTESYQKGQVIDIFLEKQFEKPYYGFLKNKKREGCKAQLEKKKA